MEYSPAIEVTVPPRPSLALRLRGPGPASGSPEVELTLPEAGPARLEWLDLSGRRLGAREVGTLGPGTHLVRLDDARSLPPGLYFLRLVQRERAVVARALILK